MKTTKNPAAVALGKLSRVNPSPAQNAASAANGKKGGRPKFHRYTLHNSFHRTEATILLPELPESERDAWRDIEAAAWKETNTGTDRAAGPATAKMKRIARALCGMKDCCCGIVR
jgi:hypothetical protein